jgi:hypothetical protein
VARRPCSRMLASFSRYVPWYQTLGMPSASSGCTRRPATEPSIETPHCHVFLTWLSDLLRHKLGRVKSDSKEEVSDGAKSSSSAHAAAREAQEAVS